MCAVTLGVCRDVCSDVFSDIGRGGDVCSNAERVSRCVTCGTMLRA